MRPSIVGLVGGLLRPGLTVDVAGSAARTRAASSRGETPGCGDVDAS